MIIFRDTQALRNELALCRKRQETIGAVLTMGALHEGHLALFEYARAKCDKVVGTIFVNPLQFDKKDDLKAYPSTFEQDVGALRKGRSDFLFAPDYHDIYPAGDETIVETQKSANILHGKTRKGHFRGVTTVVARFFNIIQPDMTVFGEKDYQQLHIIRRMVKDLHFPVEIHGHKTVRASDGLALSSRNQRLGDRERKSAPVLYRALEAVRKAPRPIEVAQIKELMRHIIQKEPCVENITIDIVAAETLAPLEGRLTESAAIMVSAEFGGILLLDQMVISPEEWGE